jgi:very-short-patch-repair endonuclease
MYICECCGKEVTEYYGSGRFCSRSCSCRWVAIHQSPEAVARKVAAGAKNLRHEKGVANVPKGSVPIGTYHWTPEQKAKHSVRMKEVMSDPGIRAKLSESSRGRVVSDATRKKISEKVLQSYKDGRNKGWTTRRNQESCAESFWRSVLDNNQIEYQQEYHISRSSLGLSGGGCYSLDFLLPGNVDLEIDGHQHYETSRREHDQFRDNKLKEAGYTIYRIRYVNPKNSLIVKRDIENFLNWYENHINHGNHEV